MAIFTKKYIVEAYKSKYSDYLDDDDEEDEDDEETSKNKKDNTHIEIHHLQKDDIRRVLTLLISKISNYPKLKKCCDFTDLFYKDHINDDGKRVSPIEDYYNSPSKSFFQLVSGDIYSGYPDKDNREDYEKDEKAFVKEVNEELQNRKINAKFSVGPDKDDEAISFGIRSTT